VKFDGCRGHDPARRRGRAAVHAPRLRLDRGRFPAIVNAARSITAKSFLIDGEAVCCDENGVPVFQMLRRRRNEATVFLYAFDPLQLDGRDLRREPIKARKAALAKLIRGPAPACN
jgi:bifunctional non-homologous end joining protein LigD